MLFLLSILTLASCEEQHCSDWAVRCGAALKLSAVYRTTKTEDVCLLEKEGFCMLNAVTPDGKKVVETDCLETLPVDCAKQLHEHFCFKVGPSEDAGDTKHPFMAVRYSNGLYSINQAGLYLDTKPGYGGCRYWGKVENSVIGEFDSRQHIDALTVVHRPQGSIAVVRFAYVPASSWCSSYESCMSSEQALVFSMDDYPISECSSKFGIWDKPFYSENGNWISQGDASEAGRDNLALVFGDRFTIPMPVEAVFYVDKSLSGRNAVSPRPSCKFLSIGNRAVSMSLVSHPKFVFLPSLGTAEDGLESFLCESDETCVDRTWNRRAKCHMDVSQHPYGRCRIYMGFGESCSEEREKLCVDGLDCVGGFCTPLISI